MQLGNWTPKKGDVWFQPKFEGLRTRKAANITFTPKAGGFAAPKADVSIKAQTPAKTSAAAVFRQEEVPLGLPLCPT